MPLQTGTWQRPVLCWALALLLACCPPWLLPARLLFPSSHFLLATARLPLAAHGWALVPTPCPGLGPALPTALQCACEQAAQVVQRLPAADRARLRLAALCLHGRGLPADVAALILAHAV